MLNLLKICKMLVTGQIFENLNILNLNLSVRASSYSDIDLISYIMFGFVVVHQGYFSAVAWLLLNSTRFYLL